MKSVFLVLVIGLTLNSCIPLPMEQGVCKTSEGDVNTYNVIGVWKKDYEFNSALNFRLLYIVQGGAEAVIESDDSIEGWDVLYNSAICEKIISNGIETKPAKAGLYFHDDLQKRIFTQMVDLEENEDEPITAQTRYSFSGNCNKTKLTLTTGSKVETYTFYASNPSTDSCRFSE